MTLSLRAEPQDALEENTLPTPADLQPTPQSFWQRIQFNMRLQPQWDALSTDYELVQDPDNVDNAFMRRIYLGAKAQITDRIGFVINTNYISYDEYWHEIFEKLYLSVRLAPRLRLTIGYRRAPLGIEETTSSGKIKTVERSIGTRYFTEDFVARRTGIYLEGHLTGDFYWDAAITESEGTVAVNTDSHDFSLYGRLRWEKQWNGLTHQVGLAAATMPNPVDNDYLNRYWNLYWTTQGDRFALMVEAIGGEVSLSGNNSDKTRPLSFTIIPSWKISEPFEIVTRYSKIDAGGGIGIPIRRVFRHAPENGPALYNRGETYYLGFNWYIRGNQLKLTAGYEWASFRQNMTGSQGKADAQGFRSRLQFDF